MSVRFEDYRRVDAVTMPFRTRILLPEVTVIYIAEHVRLNVPIDGRLYARPAQ